MRKILYLEHPQADLAAYRIYKGLCELFGDENIVDFPYRKEYRAEKDYHDGEYLNTLRKDHIENKNLPYGIPPFSPGEDVVSGGKKDKNQEYNWGYFIPKDLNTFGGYPLVGEKTKGRDYSEDQIIKMIKNNEFCFIILSTSHRVCTIALARLRDAVGGLNKLPPIIYTDNGERDELCEHWAHVFNPAMIFKCCLTEEVKSLYKNKYNWNILPLQCSNFMIGQDFKQHFKDNFKKFNNEKYFDVHYGFFSSYNRESIIKIMDNYVKDKNISFANKTDYYPFYLELLSSSKIAITHRGVCRATSRYWDIPMFETLMLCDATMGCVHEYPFEDGKTAVFYSDDKDTQKEEIYDKCDFYLKNDTLRTKIAVAGSEHLRQHHTTRARAEQMIQKIKRNGIEVP
jgi:hypothetical protein